MPVLNSKDKGSLYVKINVLIPKFGDEDKEKLKTFFEQRKAREE